MTQGTSPSVLLMNSLHRLLLHADVLFDFLQTIIRNGRQMFLVFVEERRRLVVGEGRRDLLHRVLRVRWPHRRAEREPGADAAV